MDSDALIKITKGSMKEPIVSAFEVHIPAKVRAETVEEGKAGGHPDATLIEQNVSRGKIKVVEAAKSTAIERIIAGINLVGGEADSVRLFRQGGYDAIASDDSRFVGLLHGLGIPYLTPAAMVIYLVRRKRISREEGRQRLEALSESISSDEYLATINALKESE